VNATNQVLRCEECGAKADEKARSWRTFLGYDPREDDFPAGVTYCPDCAEREFGPVASGAASE
jgi:hypothetical protein